MMPVVHHLWQSTLCVAVAWLLTPALRKNRAAVRYRLWLAASVKFLVPFSLLVAAGAQLGWRIPSAAGPSPFSFVPFSFVPFSLVMDEMGLSAAPATPMPPVSNQLPTVLFGIWLCGFIIGIVSWVRWWHGMRRIRRMATSLKLSLAVPVLSSPERLEPGVFGILHPVLLLPQGIADRLTAPQLDAILAHELCHVQRRDNLTAAIHMVVETIFWFHPLLWWIRARLVEERERACDEEVLRMGREAQSYAEAILQVCHFYLQSPSVCVSGVTGADLRKRIDAILSHRIGRTLDRGRKLLLAGVGMAMVAGPIGMGILTAPRSDAQTHARLSQNEISEADGPRFQEISINPGTTGSQSSVGDGSIAYRNYTLKILVEIAYRVKSFQIEGGPDWLDTERFDVVAKTKRHAQGGLLRQLEEALLQDRFKLKFHRETRELPMYNLLLKGDAPGLVEPDDCEPGPPPSRPSRPDQRLAPNCGGAAGRPGQLVARNMILFGIIDNLSRAAGRIIVDKTGLNPQERFDMTLNWTPQDDSSFVAAVEKQLGLQLQETKGPVSILVIDSAERPTEAIR